MKITCEACQARYSISDDKIQGRSFKIRCKKCGNVIVVRTEGGAAPAALRPSSAIEVPGEAVWHIVVDGEQVGPLGAADVRARVGRGEVSGDTYVWKEGFTDWVKLASVAELSESPGPAAVPRASVRMPAAAPAALAAAHAADDADVFAAPTMVGGGVQDLFASPARAPAPAPARATGGRAAVVASPLAESMADPMEARGGNGAAAMPAQNDFAMTGQRNENSVLFSLANLEALAAPGAPSLGASSAPGASAFPSEASGLIDIRAMAAVTLNQGGGDIRGVPELPAFGATAFSPVAPVLLPTAASSGPPKWVFVLGGIGVLVIVLLGFATLKILTKDDSPAVAMAPAAAPAAPVAPAAGGVAPAAATQGAPPATPSPAADEKLPPREEPAAAAAPAEKAAPAKSARPPAAKAGGARKPAKSGAPAAAIPAPPPPPASRPAPAEKPAQKGSDLDNLLESALNKPSRSAPRGEDAPGPSRAAAPQAALGPLGRDDIVRAMQGVMPRVKDCYNQFKVPGTAMVKVNVARGGRVSGAAVSGKFAGTPTGTCVESAVRAARVPPCDATSFDYPFPLR